MLTDSRGIAVSTTSTVALEAYETALTQFHSFHGDPLATIDEALAADPEFVLGHLFKACVLSTLSERRYLPLVVESTARAMALESTATERERRLIAATRLLARGDWDRACRAFDEVLMVCPRDSLTIQTAHTLDFFRGDALNLRNRTSRVLPHWSPQVPGYSYVLAMHAFGLEECNQYADAESAGRRALDLDPRNGYAIHAVTHVMEMQGRIDEGIDFLESRVQDWAPDDAFAFHNWWHLALFQLDRGRIDEVLRLYDERIHPVPAQFLMPLVDATAMLWRLELEGVDVGNRWEAVAGTWLERLNEERGHYAFNDFHAMLAFAASGHDEALGRMVDDMAFTARATSGSNPAMAREVGVALADGVRAFAACRYGDAIEAIESVRDRAHRFGGSHAQRDVLTLTLVHAAMRSGDTARARHYLAERTVHKPQSAWGWRLLDRTARIDARADNRAVLARTA
ncbi:MAG: tetratricopeptide repeat protein [Proteobacteria bacterium]|nr:tetratricopeptide repeat protein [Burkholderiales bacterium]